MEVLLIIIGGAFATYAVELAKKQGWRVDLTLLAASTLLGSVYFFAQEFLEPALFERIVQSILTIGGTAALIYNFLIKQLQ